MQSFSDIRLSAIKTENEMRVQHLKDAYAEQQERNEKHHDVLMGYLKEEHDVKMQGLRELNSKKLELEKAFAAGRGEEEESSEARAKGVGVDEEAQGNEREEQVEGLNKKRKIDREE